MVAESCWQRADDEQRALVKLNGGSHRFRPNSTFTRRRHDLRLRHATTLANVSANLELLDVDEWTRKQRASMIRPPFSENRTRQAFNEDRGVGDAGPGWTSHRLHEGNALRRLDGITPPLASSKRWQRGSMIMPRRCSVCRTRWPCCWSKWPVMCLNARLDTGLRTPPV